MRQLGIGLIITGVGVIFQSWLNLKGWTCDLLWMVGGLAAMIFVPSFRQIAALKLYWKLALLFASISGFIVLLTLVHSLSGLGLECSSSTTLMLIGAGLILFDRLDNRKTNKNCRSRF
jgi:hypothetical protein